MPGGGICQDELSPRPWAGAGGTRVWSPRPSPLSQRLSDRSLRRPLRNRCSPVRLPAPPGGGGGCVCAGWSPEPLLAPPASRPLPQTRVETLSPRGSRPVQVRSGAWIPPSLARSCPERRGSAPGSVPLVGAEARRLRAASGVGEARPSGSRRQPGSPPAMFLCSGVGWGAGRAGGCGRGPRRPLVPAPARHEPRPPARAVRAVGTRRIAVVTGRVCPKQRPGPPFGQFPLQDSQNHFGGSLSATRRGPPRFLLGPCAAAVCPPPRTFGGSTGAGPDLPGPGCCPGPALHRSQIRGGHSASLSASVSSSAGEGSSRYPVRGPLVPDHLP